jgi:hypothetical protein
MDKQDARATSSSVSERIAATTQVKKTATACWVCRRERKPMSKILVGCNRGNNVDEKKNGMPIRYESNVPHTEQKHYRYVYALKLLQ